MALPPHPDDSLLPAPRRAPTQNLTVSVVELKALDDTLHRASKSLAALGHVCAAASQACRGEKEVIDEAREAVRARIETAGVQWNPA